STRPRELAGRHVAQRIVWPAVVVVRVPDAGQRPSMLHVVELLRVQELIPTFAVEALRVPVLRSGQLALFVNVAFIFRCGLTSQQSNVSLQPLGFGLISFTLRK